MVGLKPPICKKCRVPTVKADAGLFSSIPYWYCRNCKSEVNPAGYAVEPVKEEESEGLEDLEKFLKDELDSWENETSFWDLDADPGYAYPPPAGFRPNTGKK